jgi:putative transposase
MADNNGFPQKRHPVHQPLWDSGNRSSVIFLTVCVAHRRQVLATPEMHDRLLRTWNAATHWMVGRYVIMPDHIHLFCAPGTNPPSSLASWIAYWKRLVAFEYDQALWQKNYWDTQLRHHENYAQKWDYVRNNPVRAGLCADPGDWSFQGELNLLRWHD